ncbi:MAG: TonB family protein [Ekhidna sp.]|nr:TonB family protein [Ekhidna sp.]
MSHKKDHNKRTERYLKGEMTSKEAHDFERETLDDPFAMEAIEGLESEDPNQVSNDIRQLQKIILNQKKAGYLWMQIAAVIVLVLISSGLLYYLTIDIKNTPLSSEIRSKEKSTQAMDTSDSSAIIQNQELIAEKTAGKIEDELQGDSEEDSEDSEISTTSVAAQATSNLDTYAEIEELEKALTSQSKKLETEVSETQSSQVAIIEEADLDEVVVNSTPLANNIESDGAAIVIEKPQRISTAKKVMSTAGSRSQATSTIAEQSESPNQNIIQGRITDETGESLPGVNIVIKGSTIGVTSDLDGKYQLPKSKDAVFVYSFVGFETQEIAVGSRSNIDVVMTGGLELQEVVVTAYGSEEYNNAVTRAKPLGGFRAYKKYLENSLKYPKEAKREKIEGAVVLELLINSLGKVESITVLKSLGYGCDKEAKRLVKEGASWEAAKRDGTNIEDTVKVKVKFNLD